MEETKKKTRFPAGSIILLLYVIIAVTNVITFVSKDPYIGPMYYITNALLIGQIAFFALMLIMRKTGITLLIAGCVGIVRLLVGIGGGNILLLIAEITEILAWCCIAVKSLKEMNIDVLPSIDEKILKKIFLFITENRIS